jgi:hypothetical protein
MKLGLIVGLACSVTTSAQKLTDISQLGALATHLSAHADDPKLNCEVLLLGALSEMLGQIPTSSVRLVVFNLEQQKELFRQDSFTLESLDRLGQALNDLNLGTVDYRVLQNAKGHLSLLAGLINAEIRSMPPSNAVIFFGPQERYHDKIRGEDLEKPRAPGPQFFYLQFRPVPQVVKEKRPDHRYEETYRIATQDSFDSVSLAVKELKGHSSPIYSPEGFVNAVQRVKDVVLASISTPP